MGLISPETEESLRLRVALSTMFFTSDKNIMVCTSFTSEYSGSQCMWALATRRSCFSMPCRGLPAKKSGSYFRRMLLFYLPLLISIAIRQNKRVLQRGQFLPDCSIISLRTSRRTATPMLSLVITRLIMTSEPSELAMASWLNSTVCFWTKLNLKALMGGVGRFF